MTRLALACACLLSFLGAGCGGEETAPLPASGPGAAPAAEAGPAAGPPAAPAQARTVDAAALAELLAAAPDTTLDPTRAAPGGALRPIGELLDARETRPADGPALQDPAALFGNQGRFVRAAPDDSGPFTGVTNTLMAGVVQDVIDDANRLVRLPRDVPVRTRRCGQKNAFYSPSEHAITICNELLADLNATMAASGRSDALALTLGGVEFIVAHEIGHAMQYELDLPTLGLPENVADQVAITLALKGDDGPRMLGAMMYYHDGAEDDPTPFFDEHAFNSQRMANVACMAYGANPTANAWLVGSRYLPLAPQHPDPRVREYAERRLAFCRQDFGTMMRNVERLTEPFRPRQG